MSNFGRRTWDRDEYAQLEREPKDQARKLVDTLTPEQLARLKEKYSNHDALVKDATKGNHERVLASGLSSYKKGKQFGFYCDLCDLTFKDTLQFVDHLNHKIHEIRFERIFEEPLIQDLRDNDIVPFNEYEENYSKTIGEFVKQQVPKPKKIKNNTKNNVKKEKANDAEANPSDISALLGFGTFASTKR